VPEDAESGRGTSRGTLYISSTGTAHVGTPKRAFPKGGGEQLVMRCGARLDERAGLPLNGHRLADLHDDGDLCGDCLDAAQKHG